MRIAVAGGTGLVGQYVVDAVAEQGDTPLILSREHKMDLVEGFALIPALEGVDAIIDVTNPSGRKAPPPAVFFPKVAANLQAAGERAGVQHIVTLSIVGANRVPDSEYYQAKIAQEQQTVAGNVPATVVRSTQFFEFPEQLSDRAVRGVLAVLPRMRIQPVASASVGRKLAAIARQPALEEPLELAGPDVYELHHLARRLLRDRGRLAYVIPIRRSGAAGRAMADGALLPGPDATILEPSFDEWLAEHGGLARRRP